MAFEQFPNLPIMTRRQALKQAACGMGSLALASLLLDEQSSASPPEQSLAARESHFPAKARSVIFLFMQGGPSQVDLFDPKPILSKYDGKNAPFQVDQRSINGSSRLMASPFKFQQRGQCGMDVSELLPSLSKCVDEMALIRSATSARFDHDNAILLFNSGRAIPGFPAMGSWISYGLGTENQELPSYVAMGGEGRPWAWTSGWLPPLHQGTQFSTSGTPILDLNRPSGVSQQQQSEFLRFVEALNTKHFEQRPDELELEARISNFELAARMQVSATEVVDVSDEPAHIQQSYGIGQSTTESIGMQCLMARRLVEAGVRFVQINMTNWDHHSQLRKKLTECCQQVDQPIAALIADLRQRGLLDSTLILWSGEFGRLPTVEGNQGRDHGPHGYSLWMAGGGIKGGTIYGATDEFGYRAVDSPITQNHIHATILRLMGLDFERLTYPFEGRDETLIGVNEAHVLEKLVA